MATYVYTRGPYTHQPTLSDYHFVRGTSAPRVAYSRINTKVIPRSTSTLTLNSEQIARANVTNKPVLLTNSAGGHTYWLSNRYRPSGRFGQAEHHSLRWVHPLDNYLFLAPPFADHLFCGSQDTCFHRAWWF